MEISTFLKKNLNKRTSLTHKTQDHSHNNNTLEESKTILDRKKNLNQTDLQVKRDSKYYNNNTRNSFN